MLGNRERKRETKRKWKVEEEDKGRIVWHFSNKYKEFKSLETEVLFTKKQKQKNKKQKKLIFLKIIPPIFGIQHTYCGTDSHVRREILEVKSS